MDRNTSFCSASLFDLVALRKESVDRNSCLSRYDNLHQRSLSARRAWIEITNSLDDILAGVVALRKESVDRNYYADKDCDWVRVSLSARRAWIEIPQFRR